MIRGNVMGSSLDFNQRSSTWDGLERREIRALVAKHLGIDVARVTDEAHFRNDLGARWLDRLELLILVEDQFADLEIRDEDADQIEVVSDLIRCVEGARKRDSAAPLGDGGVGAGLMA